MKYVRLVLIIALILVVIAGFGWLVLQAGSITYSDGVRTITTSPLIAAFSLLLVTAALMIIWGFVAWLIALPAKIKRANIENNRKKVIELFGGAFAAFESGDYLDSRRIAQKALNLFPESPAIKLLNARYAFASDDYQAAEKLFGELSQINGYEVAARKGLAEIASKSNNYSAAISHAEAALQISKKAVWPVEMIFDERVNHADWEGALDTLDDAEKRGLIGKKTLARRRAVVFTAAAARAERLGDLQKALDYSSRAAKLSSGFAPAAVMAARLQNMSGKQWAAASTIEHAWELEPHPALAIAYKDLKAGETKDAIANWADGLVKLKPEHRESRILQAENAIDRGDAASAGAILDGLIQDRATSRLWGLKAQVAQLMQDSIKYNEYMHNAATAPREPDWSDLDPEGNAFAYEDEDWARMIESYGDKGVLIHPRLERLQPSRALSPVVSEPSVPVIAAPESTSGIVKSEVKTVIAPPAVDGLEAYSELAEDDANTKTKKGWFNI